MALESQIDSAAYKTKAPAGNDEGWHVLALAKADDETEAAERAKAAWMNRRLANRHECTGLCEAPEHRRDVIAGLEVAQALGLIPYRYEPGQSSLRWCGRCKKTRPETEFDGDTTRTRAQVVVACCRSCAEARRKARRRRRKKTA